MSVEEVTEAPNWLIKLEEQRERRLKAKLGHEAGAGAPCQKCGDKCPGLDLHFWRKICKLCKCGKEDHDVIDDDIYGFLQFQLLGNKPIKARSIFLAGKKDAITLDWTPIGSNNDVKKYLEGLPEELLPVKGSEAAKIRKQRLLKQVPAHDIDASLCHALSPEEIQQLEEYVAHIKSHSVGQGKIIQIPIFRGEQHKFGPTNTQFINQQIPGILSSSEVVTLQPKNLAQNLQNLSLNDNRAAFLNSQIPTENINYVKYDSTHPNYSPNTINQKIDQQNPIQIGKITDINYPTQNLPVSEHLVSDKIIAQHPVTGEKYYIQNPEFAKQVNQISQKTPDFGQKFVKNHPYGENPEKMSPNMNTIHSESPLVPANFEKINFDPNLAYSENFGQNAFMSQNIPYSTNFGPNSQNLGAHLDPNMSFSDPNSGQYDPNNRNLGRNAPYSSNLDPTAQNLAFNDPKTGQYNKNVPYNAKFDQNAQNYNDLDPKSKNLAFNDPISGQNDPYNKNIPYNAKYDQKTQNMDPKSKNLTYNDPNSGQMDPYNKNISYDPKLDSSTQNLGSLDPNIQNLAYNDPNLCQNDPYNKNIPYNSKIPHLDPNLSYNDPTMGQNNPYNPKLDPKLQNLGPYTNLDPNLTYNDPNLTYKDPNSQKLASNLDPNVQNVDSNLENLVHLPLTTSNVEKHQEQFLNSDFASLNKNRVPKTVFNAENKINPYEIEQNLSSVGFLRDIDYNVGKIPETDIINANPITCHKCKEIFRDGDFAVSVERTDSLWHSDCFKCFTCSQPLADLLYFYHKETDNIYCGRDYALLKNIPRCAACDELIFVREYCLAEDRTFHIKHFCCFECDLPLAGKQYVMENNQPNCVDCYEKLKAERCIDCGYVIGPEEQGVSLQGLHWHASEKCFACKYCRKGLLGGKMLLRNQNLFCSDVCFKTYHA